MESHKSVDTRAGGYVALYIPTETETLFQAFNARLTDWGQIVTEQVASFSFIRGGWVQDSQLRWIRMMVPSGPEQAVRTAIKPMRIALKETVLRFARACAESRVERGHEEDEVLSLIEDLTNGTIPTGGKRQFGSRGRLIEYILENKKVESPGCRICPACLKETLNCFSLCLHCNGLWVSDGIRPLVFEIIDDDTDEDEETKRQIDGQIKKEQDAIFQETVYQAQREAETQSQFSFDPDEVDYGDEQNEGDETFISVHDEKDVPMDVDDEDDDELQRERANM